MVMTLRRENLFAVHARVQDSNSGGRRVKQSEGSEWRRAEAHSTHLRKQPQLCLLQLLLPP